MTTLAMKTPLPHPLTSLILGVALATAACEPPVPTPDALGIGPEMEGVSLGMTAADFVALHPTPDDTAFLSYVVEVKDSLGYRAHFEPIDEAEEPYPESALRLVALVKVELGVPREAWAERVAELSRRFGDATCYAVETSRTKAYWAEWPTEPGLTLGLEEILANTANGDVTTVTRLTSTFGRSPLEADPPAVSFERPECSLPER